MMRSGCVTKRITMKVWGAEGAGQCHQQSMLRTHGGRGMGDSTCKRAGFMLLDTCVFYYRGSLWH